MGRTGIGIGLGLSFGGSRPYAGYDPTPLGGTLLAAYDANYGITLGTGVSLWMPMFGPHVGDPSWGWSQATSSYQPVWGARSDGKREVLADGVDDFMACPALGAATPSASFTVVVSGKLVCSGSHPYGDPIEIYNSTTGTTGGEPNDQTLSMLSNDVSFGSVRSMSAGTYRLQKDVSGMSGSNASRHTAAIQKVGSLWTIKWGGVDTTATDSGVNATQADSAVLFKRQNSWPGDISISALWVFSGAVTDLNVALAAMKSLYPDLSA